MRTPLTTLALLFALCCPLTARAQTPDTLPLLTLDEAVRTALEANHSIRIARNDAAIARNDHTRGNAGYLPTVGLSARQAQSTLLSFGSGTSGFNTGTSFDLAAGVSYTLFDGFARAATYERLGAIEAREVLQAEQTTEAVLGAVVTQYYALVRQQQQLAVLQEAIALSEQRVEIAALRRDLGSASEMEVRRAQVDLNADRAALLRQQMALVDARAALNGLIGREGRLDYRVEGEIRVDRDLSLPALREAALSSNLALRAVERGQDVAEMAQREVRADWFPRVDLQAGYAFNDLTGGIGLPTNRPGGFNYGVTAAFDLFDGFNRTRRLENARLLIRNATLATDEVRSRVATNVEAAYADYRNGLALTALEAENRDLAALNVEVALEQYRLGTITPLELREVQTALTDAETRLIVARFAAKRAEVALLELSGLLMERVAP